MKYKMVKSDVKLIKVMFEVNGLVESDSGWNIMWAGTQIKRHTHGKLSTVQKINHFPATLELTRKDRLATNIKHI